MQAAEIKAALEAACAEREEVRGRLSAAERALNQARAESARRCSQNRTLLGKLAAAQVAAWPSVNLQSCFHRSPPRGGTLLHHAEQECLNDSPASSTGATQCFQCTEARHTHNF